MPEAVEECKESILMDNPDYSESRAYAICWAQQNEGQLSAPQYDVVNVAVENNIKAEAANNLLGNEDVNLDSPCWDGYTMVGTKQQNGQEVPNCVPDEDVPDADLGAVNTTHILGGTKQLADTIERTEDGDKAIYEGIKALTEGVWQDQNSREKIHYVPENIEVDLGSVVNVMHDESSVSEAGEIVDYEHGTDKQGKDAIFVDFALDTSTEAGAYADSALKAALESQGKEGFGGPSVEIPADGHRIEADGPKGYPYIAEGEIDGLGLVGQPAAKDTAFDYQTQQRSVAMGSISDKALLMQQRTMADPEVIRDTLEEHGFDTGDMTDDEVMSMAEGLHGELMEDLEGGDYEDDEEDEEDSKMGDDMEDDEEEEEDMDMMDEAGEVEGMVEAMQEEMDDVWGAIDEIKEELMGGEDGEEMGEALSEAKEELSEATQELSALKEDKQELEKRLSELENQSEEPKSLADTGGESESNYSPISPSQSRGY